jgi:hypothetical protein
MKKFYLLLVIVLSTLFISAQITVNIPLKAIDEDATIDDYSAANNYPDEIEYHVSAWTVSSTQVIWRNLFKFDLSCIPSNATIQTAQLSLFYADSNSYGIYANGLHSSLTNSNESVLQRVTAAWTENTVTWNNQPATTTTDQVILAQSTSGTQNYTNMDVTAMVQQMVSNQSLNYGFLLKLTNEIYYAQMIFASGDNPNLSKHPNLQITYTVPVQICQTFKLSSNDEDATINDYSAANNYPDEIEYHVSAWTISNTQVIWRNLLKFDLSCIPANAAIQSAHLSLFYADSNSYGIYANGLHSSLTNSNESVLQRVTSAWTENTVTWNNQPSTTATDQVILAQNTSGTQDYTNMDVTQLVQPMTSTPANNYGFELKLTSEIYYAQMIFASGDNPYPDKHPLLEVCYTIGTGINNFTSSSNVSVSPNPAFEILNVRLPENVRGVKYQIHDAIGKLTCEESKLLSSSSAGNSIDISDLQAGIYFLQLKMSDQIVTKKFLKQ